MQELRNFSLGRGYNSVPNNQNFIPKRDRRGVQKTDGPGAQQHSDAAFAQPSLSMVHGVLIRDTVLELREHELVLNTHLEPLRGTEGHLRIEDFSRAIRTMGFKTPTAAIE